MTPQQVNEAAIRLQKRLQDKKVAPGDISQTLVMCLPKLPPSFVHTKPHVALLYKEGVNLMTYVSHALWAEKRNAGERLAVNELLEGLTDPRKIVALYERFGSEGVQDYAGRIPAACRTLSKINGEDALVRRHKGWMAVQGPALEVLKTAIDMQDAERERALEVGAPARERPR